MGVICVLGSLGVILTANQTHDSVIDQVTGFKQHINPGTLGAIQESDTKTKLHSTCKLQP